MCLLSHNVMQVQMVTKISEKQGVLSSLLIKP